MMNKLCQQLRILKFPPYLNQEGHKLRGCIQSHNGFCNCSSGASYLFTDSKKPRFLLLFSTPSLLDKMHASHLHISASQFFSCSIFDQNGKQRERDNTFATRKDTLHHQILNYLTCQNSYKWKIIDEKEVLHSTHDHASKNLGLRQKGFIPLFNSYDV